MLIGLGISLSGSSFIVGVHGFLRRRRNMLLALELLGYTASFVLWLIICMIAPGLAFGLLCLAFAFWLILRLYSVE